MELQKGDDWGDIVNTAISSDNIKAPSGSEGAYANALWHQTQLLLENDGNSLSNRSIAYEYYDNVDTWDGYE